MLSVRKLRYLEGRCATETPATPPTLKVFVFPSAVERIWHTIDRHDQMLALAFRLKILNLSNKLARKRLERLLGGTRGR